MSEKFKVVLTELSRQFGTELTAKEGIASLTFDGEHVVHLAPMGEEHVVVFMYATKLVCELQALTLLRQNFFSPDPCMPRVGLSQDDGLILWNQHRLNELDGEVLSQTLMYFLSYKETLSSTGASTTELASFDSMLMV
ncbi:VopH targeting protein sycH; Type III secretory system chaperone [Vibrio harveyi]|uniref:CesT family type III secretion system chaperone n=1 Tax=Vibrio harveyi TaxID=669 RepID=UPI002AD91081|nr:CesT family type III secretion system chaperone [Vibrio harveyi]CAK6715223.1 VopH targeting protein sycH; Type III secretory system chaperone [Vibrio harveyi]